MTADAGLRSILHTHLPQVHWQAIEVGLVGRGVPDTNGCCRGVEFWVEAKATTGWTCPLEPEQCGWLLRRARAGGRVFVATRRRSPGGPRSPACDDLWLHRGADARELRDGGLRATNPLGQWAGGPRAWGWAAVLGCLLGEDVLYSTQGADEGTPQ